MIHPSIQTILSERLPCALPPYNCLDRGLCFQRKFEAVKSAACSREISRLNTDKWLLMVQWNHARGTSSWNTRTTPSPHDKDAMKFQQRRLVVENLHRIRSKAQYPDVWHGEVALVRYGVTQTYNVDTRSNRKLVQ